MAERGANRRAGAMIRADTFQMSSISREKEMPSKTTPFSRVTLWRGPREGIG
jgi:hypothetical protein